MIWTSTDGATWEPVIDLPDAAGVGLNSVEWNGSIYLVTALRDEFSAEGEYLAARSETWLSDDGLSWRVGGEIGPRPPAVGSGTHRDRSSPAADWSLGACPAIFEENQQRPAFFEREDCAAWRTVELDDVGSGSLGTVVVLPDGSLLGGRLRVAGWHELLPVRRGLLPASVAIGRRHRMDARGMSATCTSAR